MPQINILNECYTKLGFEMIMGRISNIATSSFSVLGLWTDTKRLANNQSRTDFTNAMDCYYLVGLIKYLLYQSWNVI